MPGQIDDDMIDLRLRHRVHPGDVFITPLDQQFARTFGDVETGVFQLVQHGRRIEVGGGRLHRILNHLGLRLTGRDDDRHAVGIIGDGAESDSDHQPASGHLDAAEISGRCGLGFIVGGGQAGGGKVVGAADIEADMAVRTDAAEKKADASQITDPSFIVRTVFIHPLDDIALQNLQMVFTMTNAQAQIHRLVGKYLIGRHARRYAGGPGVQQQCVPAVQAESANIERLNIVGKAVGLCRVYRIELIDLNKTQLIHPRPICRLNAVRFQILLHIPLTPFLQIMHYPFDEMFRGFTGRQGDDAIRMALHPLEKAQSGQFAQSGKIIHFNDWYLFYRGIDKLSSGPFQSDLLHSGFRG
ncbi:MAG: hypothetical protein BWY83_02801 [bacterium ADurb.Bin478]|nr:MAG: hypothetical protein BWY83_02801 [bacterium ADurb.Bin478]